MARFAKEEEIVRCIQTAQAMRYNVCFLQSGYIAFGPDAFVVVFLKIAVVFAAFVICTSESKAVTSKTTWFTPVFHDCYRVLRNCFRCHVRWVCHYGSIGKDCFIFPILEYGMELWRHLAFNQFLLHPAFVIRRRRYQVSSKIRENWKSAVNRRRSLRRSSRMMRRSAK